MRFFANDSVWKNYMTILVATILVDVCPDNFSRLANGNTLNVTVIDNTTFDISWISNADSACFSLDIISAKHNETIDGQKLRSSVSKHSTLVGYSANHNSTVEEYKYRTSELKECTNYTITVKCDHNGLYTDNATVSEEPFNIIEYRESKTTSYTSKLEKVENLKMETSNNSVLITWNEPVTHKLCIKEYRVELISNKHNRRTVKTSINTNRYLMTLLEPNVTYFGNVYGVDQDARPGRLVQFNITTNGGFLGPAFKLSAWSNVSKSISVRWDEPNLSHAVHEYVVRYRDVDNANVMGNYRTGKSMLTRHNSLTVSPLEPGVTYEITVTPKILNTDSDLSAKIKATVMSEVKYLTINDKYSGGGDHLRVNVFFYHYTRARLSVPGDLFSNHREIRNSSLIVYQDVDQGGGFNATELSSNWKVRTWAASNSYDIVLPYQTTPGHWMPFDGQTNDNVGFDIGADEGCSMINQHIHCNGPLRPDTKYRLKLRACNANECVDSWTVPFTTPKPDFWLWRGALFVIFMIATLGSFCLLKTMVSWITRNCRLCKKASNKSDVPEDMNFRNLLTKTSEEIEKEYKLLDLNLKSNLPTCEAAKPENRSKNRYNNILPYDYNRVILKSADNGYINASFIEDSSGVRRYIACQGPTANTCTDMWRMVYDQDVTTIVMLCQTIENYKIKCEKYFPNINEKLVFDDIQVQNDAMIVNDTRLFTTSELTVTKGKSKKTINHFQFHGWPDFETPNDPILLLQFCLEVQAKSDGLVVVHCSAGVGRTGSYIACDMLLRLIRQKVTRLNVFETVANLRKQRKYMVQTQAQYEFIYRIIACRISLLS